MSHAHRQEDGEDREDENREFLADIWKKKKFLSVQLYRLFPPTTASFPSFMKDFLILISCKGFFARPSGFWPKPERHIFSYRVFYNQTYV